MLGFCRLLNKCNDIGGVNGFYDNFRECRRAYPSGSVASERLRPYGSSRGNKPDLLLGSWPDFGVDPPLFAPCHTLSGNSLY